MVGGSGSSPLPCLPWAPPFPVAWALGRDASACSTGMAGQERSETAFMGEAFVYSAETKYVKGHGRP